MALRKFKNRNGAEWALEVPGPGLDQRTFDARVGKGTYVLLPDDPGPDADSEPDMPNRKAEYPEPLEPVSVVTPEPDAATAYEVDMVEGKNVAKTLEWAGDDPDRRAVVLEREQARGDDARQGVVKPLTATD